ncbi:hypothetical protein A3H81_03715 [Candidatus Daviesbacteria bacterium RIFCSPLOWO2_02_FULL_38_18]|nr:MAG: hypothetical protein A3D02_03445 [Candidatus Daviesbacteria bacterium RIFCSPHIGHO2_02_FULL_39_41]OGE68076.1 MAG: hypothetical protein A3H81_03715 [Candidatus Daviesbacteria bacterium RIFCSPLOWO2_02_FULL_38_18]OGE71840.1 MAG: hypothetical protein A3H18_00700 [Candidatus Daviesbacteria bacterium RIFCSPLOWO2_12_FULL_38_10]HCB23254.1 hypothetical protein [Candidatus Daviesbacteria bacterium]
MYEQITLTLKEKYRFKVISDLLKRKIVNRQTAGKLRLSVRHTQRVKVKVRILGRKAVIHGLKGKPSNRLKKMSLTP